MGKEVKKVVKEVIDITTDLETGEVVEERQRKTSYLPKEPDFVKLYIRDLGRLKNLSPATSKVMHALLKSMGYNNVIAAYSPIKKMICRDLGISVSTLNNSINDLYKKGLLIRVDRGIYLADPELFGKGAWEDIRELRLVITYKEDGTKEIKGDRANQLKLFE